MPAGKIFLSRPMSLAALAFGLTIAGCAGSQPIDYPNVVPIDKTGNFGAR